MRVRHSRGRLSFLILFLGLVFGARELPELLSLADDVSNDGDIVGLVYTEGSRRSTPSREDKPGARSYIALLIEASGLTNRTTPSVLCLSAGRSLLRLHTLQRK